GWVGERGAVVCEPVPGVASRLRCRGQVTAATRTVTYEVSVKEYGYRPEPYALADVLMYADGKPIVEITGMSVRLAGLSREAVAELWRRRAGGSLSRDPEGRAPALPSGSQLNHPLALFGKDRILAFAVGKPSEAFGEPYRAFDEGRFIARLP